MSTNCSQILPMSTYLGTFGGESVGGYALLEGCFSNEDIWVEKNTQMAIQNIFRCFIHESFVPIFLIHCYIILNFSTSLNNFHL